MNYLPDKPLFEPVHALMRNQNLRLLRCSAVALLGIWLGYVTGPDTRAQVPLAITEAQRICLIRRTTKAARSINVVLGC